MLNEAKTSPKMWYGYSLSSPTASADLEDSPTQLYKYAYRQSTTLILLQANTQGSLSRQCLARAGFQ